eukprot:TRINITY_DN6422_c2_g2_i1.p1 TRINITY_DN6422_c2_g2~~TRINITY_DN6422_c2_g2_i1.p1  ORF type:complete len:104 (-),score=9.21 TRINITY_DN6422_c2_g2_i1:813-1124(-)
MLFQKKKQNEHTTANVKMKEYNKFVEKDRNPLLVPQVGPTANIFSLKTRIKQHKEKLIGVLSFAAKKRLVCVYFILFCSNAFCTKQKQTQELRNCQHRPPSAR